ncbi:MAG TPA: CHAT domain-containing protein [Nocardioidaceae bacterium]
MGALARTIAVLPAGWAEHQSDRIAELVSSDDALEARAWRLWLEAEWAKHGGEFGLAEQALGAADQLANGIRTRQLWDLESHGLRGRLLHDCGEPGRAHEHINWAMQNWLRVRTVLQSPNPDTGDFALDLLHSAHAMVSAIVDPHEIAELAKLLDAAPFEVTAGMWASDRVPSQTVEYVARAIELEAKVDSYSASRRLANDVLAWMRSWELESSEALRFQAGVRLGLSSAALGTHEFATAVAQADDGLALAGQLPEGTDRSGVQAELKANRGNALAMLGRTRDAAADYDTAMVAFDEAGDQTAALSMRLAKLTVRHDAGEDVTDVEVQAMIAELEDEVHRVPNSGRLRGELERTRRWWLSLLAQKESDDTERAVGLIEVLRDDQPVLRTGTRSQDHVLDLLCRAATVLRARLRALADTVVVVLEPGIRTGDRLYPPVFLVMAGGESTLVPSGDAAGRLAELGRIASIERERLLTGETTLNSPASGRLTEAAVAAWKAIPSVVTERVLAAETVLYMPSGVNAIDALPFELLRHEAGWLGMTHVVARAPSFQLLEQMLTPNARAHTNDSRAVIATVRQDSQLGVLSEALREADIVERAAEYMGLTADRRETLDTDALLDVLRRNALVHYIGHGFASEIGEVLPLTSDTGVYVDQLSDHDGMPSPLVFFDACMLGRVRHLEGGRQRGWTLALLERGAPAVIGALAPVPDSACSAVAKAFYGAVLDAPVGVAMRNARAGLEQAGLHPLIAAAYVVHGDPSARLTPGHRGGTASRVCRWPSLAARFLATEHPDDRAEIVSASCVPAAVASWANGVDVSPAEFASAVEMTIAEDPEGAAICRILLALKRFDQNPNDDDELDVAWLVAEAVGDRYAQLHLIDRYAPALIRRHPDLRAHLPSETRFSLNALGGGRGRLAGLAERLAHVC